MERPSSSWQGFDSLKPDSGKYKRIQLLFSSANFGYLETCAIESRRKHQPSLSPDLSCSIDLKRFASGFNNVVLEIAFSDGVFWVARIPHQTLNDNDKTSLLSEIATMRIIQQQTTIPIPRVFSFEMSTDQPFGYPYMFMEHRGHPLPNGLARTVPSEHLSKVARQLANVFAELQNLTFSRIGRLWCGDGADQPVQVIAMDWHASPGPLETSFEYFYNQKQAENREAIDLHPKDPEWLTACWVLKSGLTHMIIEDRVRGPFPLCHLDLHYGNMLFDKEYNLTGIIDWSSAQAAPLEQLSVCPEFVTFPGMSDEDNQPMIDFKHLVVLSIREMEQGQERKPPLDNPDLDITGQSNLTPLSTYMASKGAEITYRQYMSSPRGSLFAGRMVAGLIYGKSVTWEQLKEVYGAMSLC
ncbi:GDSL lipase acylhydrolase family [Fusarium pseudocircinatum]|uniref:GDSL lipase acylhydrolase family n=1 Tax=Fusarium pseudocircinatum TaxID=56676 RepID=A0A8H5KNZ3_9HYPO|nr:GDSL lipase acylhydrolase family [Fusarium pseudocircinatum]